MRFNLMRWKESQDSLAMLREVRSRATPRQLRLFSVACIRECGHLLSDPRVREAYFVLERHAEGEVSEAELHWTHTLVRRIWSEVRSRDSFWRQGDQGVCDKIVDTTFGLVVATEPTVESWVQASRTALAFHGQDTYSPLALHSTDPEWASSNQLRQSDHLRDIFGRPSLRYRANRTWLAQAGFHIRSIAETIYQERTFEELPILADALKESDCPHEELIRHCESGGVHGRGCWALDVLLGRR